MIATEKQHNNELDRIYSLKGSKVTVVKFPTVINMKEIYELVSKTELPEAADNGEHGVVSDNGAIS